MGFGTEIIFALGYDAALNTFRPVDLSDKAPQGQTTASEGEKLAFAMRFLYLAVVPVVADDHTIFEQVHENSIR